MVSEQAHTRAERDDREGQHRRDHRRERRDEIDGPVRRHRHDPFLEEQLHAVRERDEDARRAGAVGTDARLHVGHHLALDPDREHDRDEQSEEDHRHARDGEDPAQPVDLGKDHAGTAVGTSTATVVLGDPESRVLVASPGWFQGTNTTPGATCSVTLAVTSARPASVRTTTVLPSVTPSHPTNGSRRMHPPRAPV